MRRPFASCTGASLAEALVALAILATALLSLVHLFMVSGVALRRANELSTAAILAGAKAEELKSVASGTVDTAEGSEFVDVAGVVVPASDAAGVAAAYTRQWSIRPLPSDADVRVVRVRVSPGRREGAMPSDTAPPSASEVALVTLAARDVP